MKIIEESPVLDTDELPSQSKKLLGEAIENSQLVLKEYPESKYMDDAVFIIAKASFLRDEVAVAEKHFNLLLRDYPESRFYSLSEIWLAYTHFRMGMAETAELEIELILLNNPTDKEKLYLIHNVLAEIALEKDSIQQVFEHYELAAENAPANSKKTATYGKLVRIAEKNQDKERASLYLEALGEVAPDKIRIDSKMQWIIYQRELENFDKIINEIASMLGLSEFASEYMQLELELGKVYMDKGDISIAKDIFSQMVEVYSKKNETAEAYYHLGFMALMEDFNLDLAKEYFEKSKKEKSQSKYGKESKVLLNKITRFESLQSLYKEVVKNPDEEVEIDNSDFEYKEDESDLGNENPDDEINENEIVADRDDEIKEDSDPNVERYRDFRNQMEFNMGGMPGGKDIPGENEDKMNTASANPDSVLFMIGEMLLYDFNRLELSLEKFKSLTEEYPLSAFAPQAFYVLSYFEPNADWRMQLEIGFPNSSFLNTDSTQADSTLNNLIESQRDYAWSLVNNSYEESYHEFIRLYEHEQDTLAGYIAGFISDYYLNDLERAVKIYQVFTDSFPNHSYAPMIENRLNEIKENLEEIKEISQQGIDYQAAIDLLHNEFDFDSVKVLLTEISSGKSSRFKDAANNLKSVIRDYEELSEEVSSLTTLNAADSTERELAMPSPSIESDMDSILFQLAELFAHDLEFIDSAKFYHKEVINTYIDSKFRPHSLLYLSEVEPEGLWGDLLSFDYPDTSFTPDSTNFHSIYQQDIYKDNFTIAQEEKIDLCDYYLEYFPEPEIEETADEEDIPEENFEQPDTEEPKMEMPHQPPEEVVIPEEIKEEPTPEEFMIEAPLEPDKGIEIPIEPLIKVTEFYEPFNDLNGNNVWDPAELFTDLNNNNNYDEAEEFIDTNNNGQFDKAENFVDDNQNGKWDSEEPFTDQGNGIYDLGEKFEDIYDNNIWDAQIYYVDQNNNNTWDAGDPFEDLNKDGKRSYGEPYTDNNNNNRYDAPEQNGNFKFNFRAKEFSEPFTDSSNRQYDLGEDFQDLNGDGKWTAAEKFDDLNLDGKWTAAEEFIDLNGDGKWNSAEEYVDSNGDGVWTAAEEFEDLNGNKIWDAINPESVNPDSIGLPIEQIHHPGNERENIKP